MKHDKPKKKRQLNKLKPNQYRIYGIFDFDKKKLIYVNMSEEEVELEFDLVGYDEDRYDIVQFDVILI